MRSKILKIFFSLLVFSFVFFGFLFFDNFKKIEMRVKDFKQNLALKVWQQRTKKPSIRNNIVILSVDDLTAFDLSNHYPSGSVKWPLSRRDWAKVIDYIEQGKPNVLTLCFAFYNYEDITFSANSPDVVFADTLKRYNNIVLGTALNTALSSNQNSVLQPELQQNKPIKKSLVVNEKPDTEVSFPNYFSFLPIPNMFVNNSQIGYVNLTKDDDGSIRRSTPISKLVTTSESYYVPSLAFATFLKYIKYNSNFDLYKYSIKFDGYSIPVDSFGSNYINWNGLSRTYQMIPFSKIVVAAESNSKSFEYDKKLYSQDFFKNKIVIVAPTQTNADTFRTPVDKEMSIAEINANIVENYINDAKIDNLGKRKFVREIPVYVSVLLGLSFSLLIVSNVLLFRLSWLSFFNTVLLFLIYLALDVLAYVHPKVRLGILCVYPLYFMFCSTILSYTYVLYDEKSRKKFIRSIFANKVSNDVLKKLLSDSIEVNTAPDTKCVSVMYCNFSNFSQVYSKYSEKESIEKLNTVLNLITNKIYKYNGTIDKIIGEKIIAYWGYPLEAVNPSLNAVKAAVEILDELDKFNLHSEMHPQEHVDIKISINTGEVIIAETGNKRLNELSLVGDNVNLVFKMDEISNQFNKKLLISAATQKEVNDFVKSEYAGTMKIKGKDIQVGLYVPKLGKKDDKS